MEGDKSREYVHRDTAKYPQENIPEGPQTNTPKSTKKDSSLPLEEPPLGLVALPVLGHPEASKMGDLVIDPNILTKDPRVYIPVPVEAGDGQQKILRVHRKSSKLVVKSDTAVTLTWKDPDGDYEETIGERKSEEQG